MSNTISNILTIIGTEEQVAQVRSYIKGSNGESISFQSIVPMPEDLSGEHKVEIKDLPYPEGMKPISVPDWLYCRLQYWGCKLDAEPIRDEAVDAPNRILFNTPGDTPLPAMTILSMLFPEVTFSVIFCDEYEQLYCSEYTISDGDVTNKVWYDAINHIGDIPVDQQMEYYFRTHEHEREYWKKNKDGEWFDIDAKNQDEE